MLTLREMITAVRASHERLHTTVGGLDDDAVRRPSLLPGWSVAHVLTHLARNADSMVRRLEGAIDDKIVSQYEGGPAGREAAIVAGSTRGAAELVADLVAVDAAVDELFASTDQDVWLRPVVDGAGNQLEASALVWSRWREVETHHVDLGLGYVPADWPPALVDRWLPDLLTGLETRADRTALMAWALGRAPAPDLASWG